MKKKVFIGILAFASISFNAQAFWGSNNNGWGNNGWSNNGWGNGWPAWTPMYWMDELSGNNNYNDYYGNANPWAGSAMNNMPFNTNPWNNGTINGAINGGAFPPSGYSPYIGGGPNTAYPAGYPQAYRPLPGYQNFPLVPSRGPTSMRP